MIKRTKAPRTPAEQLAAREADRKRKLDEEMAAKEEKRKNQALLNTYSSEKDIDEARGRALQVNDEAIKDAERKLADAQKRQKLLASEAEFFQKKPMPMQLKLDIQNNEAEIEGAWRSARRQAEGDREHQRQVRRGQAPLPRAEQGGNGGDRGAGANVAGGVEFVVTYAGRHPVSPPQRVLSESQLNGLGMALFLAHLKTDPLEWRTVVLDDVVNSFDANHRVGLARLLAEEFADWQVVALTHDRTFAEVTRRLVPKWRQLQIVAWTPSGGPVISDGNPRAQLAGRVAAGEAASQLGGLARTALEQALSRPLERLGLEMRFDPFARFGAKEYLDALRHGLRSRGSSLAESSVFARMDAATYMVNLGAHDRPMYAALTRADMSQLVDDLDDLDRALKCPKCGEPPWAASLDGGRRHQCRCSQLVV